MSRFARRYSTRVVMRAKELKRAGWSAPKIVGIIEAEMGVRPHPGSVYAWCSGNGKGRTLAAARNARVRKRQSYEKKPRLRVSDDWVLERMGELRAAGLSFRAVALAAGVWWGDSLTEDQVRSRLEGRREYAKRRAA